MVTSDRCPNDKNALHKVGRLRFCTACITVYGSVAPTGLFRAPVFDIVTETVAAMKAAESRATAAEQAVSVLTAERDYYRRRMAWSASVFAEIEMDLPHETDADAWDRELIRKCRMVRRRLAAAAAAEPPRGDLIGEGA